MLSNWTNLYCLVVLLAWSTTLNAAWSAESTTPSVEIVALHDATKDGTAMLELLFTNRSQSPVTIPFWGAIKKKHYNELSSSTQQATTKSPFRCTVDGNPMDDFFLGAFAEIRYDWRVNGSSCKKDVYELNVNQIDLRSRQSQKVAIPVHIPTSDGKYSLIITFDNTSVMIPTKAAGNRLLSTNYAFFKHSTRADVSIQRPNPNQEIPKAR